MIKKHDHRKNNRQLLKLPKTQKANTMHFDGDSLYSSNVSDSADRISLVGRGKKKDMSGDAESTHSHASSVDGKHDSSHITQLSKVKANNFDL